MQSERDEVDGCNFFLGLFCGVALGVAAWVLIGLAVCRFRG